MIGEVVARAVIHSSYCDGLEDGTIGFRSRWRCGWCVAEEKAGAGRNSLLSEARISSPIDSCDPYQNSRKSVIYETHWRQVRSRPNNTFHPRSTQNITQNADAGAAEREQFSRMVRERQDAASEGQRELVPHPRLTLRACALPSPRGREFIAANKLQTKERTNRWGFRVRSTVLPARG